MRHKVLIGSVIAVILLALVPLFVHSPYRIDLFIIVIVNAILAMTFIMMLRAGLVSLGISAFWGIGAYASVVLTKNLHLSFWLSLPLSGLIAGVFALVLGYFVISSGAGGIGFVMITAVLGMLFVVTIGNIHSLGGYLGITDIPIPNPIHIPFLQPIEFVSKTPYFYLALVLLVIVVLICHAFYSSSTGRAWRAIGLNSRLAESIGIDIVKYKLLAFVAASAIAGLIGSFYVHYEGYIVPTTYGMSVNIFIQIYAILGGIGYAILGPIVGSTAMTIFTKFVGATLSISNILSGAMLILVIMLLPGGLLSLLDWRTAFTGWLSKKGKTIRSSLSTRHKADE
jgi:branched-chain amino acid transport system permease protein